MALLRLFVLLCGIPLVFSYTDSSINLLVRSSTITRRYCVELAKLPNGNVVNVTGFSWHQPYLAAQSVNACNITDLETSLPSTFPRYTLLILREQQCKMTEHAWNVESTFGKEISLMILSNRTDTEYSLTLNTTAMPVSIPVLVFWTKDFDRMNRSFSVDISQLQFSIAYPLNLPKKFRPEVFLMFLLVLFILLSGNFWAADEFRRVALHSDQDHHSTSTLITTASSLQRTSPEEGSSSDQTNNTNVVNVEDPRFSTQKTRRNTDPAVLSMPCCTIIMILAFAVGWLLLIYYFPKVMIHVLQVMFCLGAFSSLVSCLTRLSYFLPVLRRYQLFSHSCRRPCTCKLRPLNVFTLCAMVFSLSLVIVWYIFRQASWSWILQDFLGAAICISILSIYRLGNMRVITLILLGFFIYDIFFVFITPYISIFNSSSSSPSPSKPTTRAPLSMTAPIVSGDVLTQMAPSTTYRRLARNPSVMEQVALGLGANGEVVPLVFSLPIFIPESEVDPCLNPPRSILGFGDIILPGILLTFCKLFDIASKNPWPIYYVQALISYFLGLSFTHLALYLMNTAQPALLYLVPCILLSTIFTGLCRGDLRELYTGKRLEALLHPTSKPSSALLAGMDHSNGETRTNPSAIIAVGETTDA